MPKLPLPGTTIAERAPYTLLSVARHVLHHALEALGHVVERAVGVDDRIFEQAVGVDVGKQSGHAVLSSRGFRSAGAYQPRARRRPRAHHARQRVIHLGGRAQAHRVGAHAARRHGLQARVRRQVLRVQAQLDQVLGGRPQHRELLLAPQADVGLLRCPLARVRARRLSASRPRAAAAAAPWHRRRWRPAGRPRAPAAARPARRRARSGSGLSMKWATALASP